jgi:site-specific DNA-methyltransferase (adenine-specific)
MIQGENYTVHIGNNLDILPTLPDCSVDSIVTDPPYELGFMGKKWDNTGIAYNTELWRECLRVLKPGGHLLSFGGTRTWHRVAVAIEDAGFEVRDSIAWMYGSGFPKSLDVSKAIDKGTGENRERQLRFTEWMRQSGLAQKDCAKLLEPIAKNPESAAAMARHYYTDKTQPAIPTADIFDILKPYLPEVPEEIERLVAERTGIEWTAYKNRQVVGQKVKGKMNGDSILASPKTYEKLGRTIGYGEFDITTSATPEAQQWEGWGTALKPAFEPIVVARKPLIGTVAENVLTYGTGGLNIDASRIGTEENLGRPQGTAPQPMSWGEKKENYSTEGNPKGRWPANVILDEYSAELLDEQTEGKITQGHWANTKVSGYGEFGGGKSEYLGTGRKAEDDIKGASRFFYVAKASKRDRNEGLEELPETTAAEMVDREEDSAGMNSPRAGAGRTSGAKNFHPTVKPTDLMRYLIKLVTPPNGIVLDPFTGSGSTGKAAILDGFRFIGIEMTEDYIPIIEGRLKHAADERSEGLF